MHPEREASLFRTNFNWTDVGYVRCMCRVKLELKFPSGGAFKALQRLQAGCRSRIDPMHTKGRELPALPNVDDGIPVRNRYQRLIQASNFEYDVATWPCRDMAALLVAGSSTY